MSRRGGVLAGARAVGPAGTNRQGAAAPPGSALAQLGNNPAAPGGPRPVNATGNWGDAYGALGLPRPPSQFTDAAFGPYPPILSVPINEPDDGTGQIQARREEYRVGWNLPVGQPGTEGLKLADFNTLRSLAELYSVARACIQYLKSEITSLEWDILPTKDAAKAMRNDQGKMRDFGERRGKAIKFFKRPDPDYNSWQSWLSDVLEEMLVYDALSIVLRPKWGRGLGKGLLGSDLDSLNLVSGPTIRPLYDVLGGTPRPPAVAYQQYLYGVPRSDWMDVMTGRDIEAAGLSGADVKAFRGSQLLYLREVPRRHTPYGMPPVERALVPIMSGLSKQGYQLDYYKEGTVPAVYISPGGDLSPNQIRELQDALNGVAGDPAFHHKVIVLPSGSTVQPQRPASLADQFDEIVMAQTCMGFGVAPMAIGIMPKVSTTASPGAANQMAKMTGNNQEKGSQKPRLIFLANVCDFILGEVCQQTDMRFVFDGMQEEEDEETKTNLIVNQLSHALLTVDEGRDELGRQPFGTPKSTEPGVFTPTGFVTLAEQAAQQEQQMQMQQQMQANMAGGAAPPRPGTSPGKGEDEGDEDGKNPAAGGGKPPKPSGGGKKPKKSGKGPSTNETASAHTAAAQASAAAQQKPDTANKAATTTAPPQQSATDQPVPPTDVDDAVDDALLAAASALIIKQVIDLMLDLYLGQVSLLTAVQQGVAAITQAYLRLMLGASRIAATRHPGTDELSYQHLEALAAQRAETQRTYLTSLSKAVTNAQRAGAAPTWLPQRARLYGESATPAWHEAYGATLQAANPEYEIIWRLGETEHCALCLERADRAFTFESLPGWPGDGGFGGPICEGGQLCFTGDTEVQAADIELGYKRWYEGDLVTVITANGHTLTGTPNHPVLTCAGWKPLGLLKDGDHLIGGRLMESVAVDPHVQAVPTALEKVVEALHGTDSTSAGGRTNRVAVAATDFHGDGVGSREVEVVRPDGELSPYGNATSGKPVRHFLLTGADVGHTALFALSHADETAYRAVGPSARLVSGGDLSGALLSGHAGPLPFDDVAAVLTHGGIGGGGDGATLIDGGAGVADPLVLSRRSELDPVLLENGLNQMKTDAGHPSDGVGGVGLQVEIDHVVSIDRRSWSGHVYNLQTASGWYVANGIISHNCGCHLDYVENGVLVDQGGNPDRELAAGYYAQQLKDITAARQKAIEEKDRFLASLPNQVGRDGSSVAGRAMDRELLRRMLANLANQRIQSSGGYGGVSVEPTDIPAKIIAGLLPPYAATRLEDVPITAIGDAVESFLRGNGGIGKGASVRLVKAELEALARHLTKGRAAGTWERKHVTAADVADLAALLETGGVTRIEAVKAVLGRRYVSLDGTVVEPEDQEDELPSRRNAAGWGGPILTPHDADGIQHDLSDLKPRAALKGASDLSDPNEVDAQHVYEQLLENYPPKAIEWVKGCRWIGPIEVPLDRVDTDDEEKWAAAHEPARVKHFAKRIKNGEDVKAGVSVQEPGEPDIKVIDGHHRYLGAKKRKRPFKTYIGFVDKNGGPWDETHLYQFHQGDDPANKAAKDCVAAGIAVLARDTGRILMLQRGLPEKNEKDPAAGTWEFPGGCLEPGENDFEAAKREWEEETGIELPKGKRGAEWRSGAYHGFVWRVKHEADVPIHDGRDDVTNPDDPDGDRIEALAWWDPDHLKGNPAVRAELRSSLSAVLSALSGGGKKAATMSKEAAGYRDGTDATHRCRNCSMFIAFGDDEAGKCTLVQGEIRTDAVCDHWEAKNAEKLGVKAWLPDLVKAGEGDEKATERLRHYWTHGEGGTVKVRWGEPGDFDRCVRHVGKYMENPQGYCAERHHDALGIWPATHAKEERDAKKATGTPGLTKRSGMVSIDLPEGTVPLHPGGVDDHHITLAYLGSNVSDAELEAALNLVRAAAPNHEPLTIRLGGIASFPPSKSSDGQVPAYVPVVKSRELASLREDLSSLSRSEHTDWHPHVTLAFLNEGDPLPAPAPVTEFQAAHISVHHGGRVWRVPLGEAEVKKVYGVSLTPGGFIGKVGPEGYIHGFICVRPPCGKGDHAKVTRDPSNGKVYLGEKGTGEYIGKIVKNSDGTYTARHNGAIIGGGKTLLQGKYADHQKAAVALGQYHSMRAMEQSALKSGDYETASHLGAAATAHAGGDAESAVFNLHHAHQSSKAGSDLSHHVSLLHQGMGGKPAEFPNHPKPAPSAHPKGYLTVHDVVETNDGTVVQVNDKKTGELIGTYHHNKVTGHYNAEHVDGTVIGGSTNQDEALDSLLAYHNDAHGGKPAPVPIKEMTEVHEPAPLADWEMQLLAADESELSAYGIHSEVVDHGWVSLQANGNVVNSQTGHVIGQVGDGPNGAVAYHNDGAKVYDGDDEDAAIEAVVNHQNANYSGFEAGTKKPVAKKTAPAKNTVPAKPASGMAPATHEVDFSHIDIKPNADDTGGDIVDINTRTKIGTYTGSQHGKVTATHNDGTTYSGYIGSTVISVAGHHNQIVNQAKAPTPSLSAPSVQSSPTSGAAWKKAGQVDVADLSLKANGDVVHKPTKTVVGHVDKQPNTPKPGTSTFTAYHADGTKTHTGVYKGNAMASIALHHNEQLGKPGTTTSAPAPAADWMKTGPIKSVNEGGVYTKPGKNGTIDVYHNGTNTKIGEYHALGLSDVIARHADNTTLGSHSSGTEAMQAIIDYHNQKIDELGSPTSSATTPAPSAPSLWHQAGKAVRPGDVTVKQNGDVIHKGTKQKIGVVYKTQGNYYTAAHEDGQGFGKYNKKADAVSNLVTYQNQATAIRDGVEEDDPTFTASETLPPGMFYAAKKNEYGDYVNQNGTYYGRLEADPAGGYTAALANGAQFHIAAPDETSAKYKLLYAHNQAVNVAKGMKETKPAVHPPLEGQTIGFSPHTSVGLAPIKPVSTSVHGLSVPTSGMAVKHEFVTPHTGAETAAVKKYTGSWYATINSKLAKQKLLGDQVPDDASGKALHKALDKTELAHDVTLYRGIYDAVGMLGPVGSQVGKVGIQHSFMSTSVKPSIAQGFGHGGVLLTVHAPKGAKAMNVINTSHYHHEAEVLFQHGTMYKVNSDVMGPDGVRRADITIVGLSSSTGNHTVYNQVGAK